MYYLCHIINHINTDNMELLEIERAFLSIPEIKTTLDLLGIKKLLNEEKKAHIKKFATALALSKRAHYVCEWFDSDEGIRITNEEGITWTKADIGLKIFGYEKAGKYVYKLLRAAKLSDELVANFNAKCDELELGGKNPNRTLEGLLKYDKDLRSSESESKGGGSDGEGDGEGAEVGVRSSTVFTMTFKRADGVNVAIRIDENGVAKTTNDREEVLSAIAFLSINHLSNPSMGEPIFDPTEYD